MTGGTPGEPAPLVSTRFVLASASPRRHELLAAAGLDFEVVASAVDEESFSGGRPETLVRRIARAKAEEVAARRPHAAVLAADTIVVLRGEVLGKPTDAAAARRMLTALRGRQHRVLTAIYLIASGRRDRVQVVASKVRMRTYEPGEIDAWIDSGGPFDKAGAYAIQDTAFAPVESYAGCYCNVKGLPLWTALGMLDQTGISPPPGHEMPPACAACPFARPRV